MAGPGEVNDGTFPVPRARTIEGAITSASQLLPSTAPVSSLLPQIIIPAISHHHHQQQQQHSLVGPSAAAAASIQAQLAAFFTQGAAAAAAAAAGVVAIPQQQQQLHHHHQQQAPAAPSNNAAAAASPSPSSHLLTSTSAAAASAAAAVQTTNMQGWSVDQIENHIKLLRQLKQHVPQSVTLLLQEHKKRADKRHAKRIANRKSASTSRARKKALVQEMTALNARLRRQALILSLLPDLVIVIDAITGTITFCSDQVERVLQHSIDDLVGAKLTDIIVPDSRDKLSNLIQKLLLANGGGGGGQQQPDPDGVKPQALVAQEQQQQHDPSAGQKKKKAKLKKGDDENEHVAQMNSGESMNAVTDSSFPLSVVKVDQDAADENDNSDESNSKQPSSLTHSSSGNSGSDDGTPKVDCGRATKKSGVASLSSKMDNSKKLSKEDSQSSDSSHASRSNNTESFSAKNLLTANANLERNVRWHNKNYFMKDSKRAGYKDDVLGAMVTANNASARLSSLQHRSSDSSEEDSGYRESNDSREETSSEEENSSESNGRRKPIAPTCNVCLIREDLTTIWCEVTSSVRTKDTEDETDDTTSINFNRGTNKKQQSTSSSTEGDRASRKRGHGEEASLQGSEDAAREDNTVGATQCKEILLCLRPIRDGDEKTDEALRFKPSKKKEKRIVSEDNLSEESNSSPADGISEEMTNNTSSADPVERASDDGKRKPSKQRVSSASKRKRPPIEDDIDKAVVESLMAMSNQKA